MDDGKNTANNILSKHDFNSQYDDEEVGYKVHMEQLANDKRRTMPLSPLAEENYNNFAAQVEKQQRRTVEREPMDPD